MPSQVKSHRFLATVYKIWLMRHIDVPEKVSSALMKEMSKARTGHALPKSSNGDTRRNSKSSNVQPTAKSGAARPDAKPKYIAVIAIVNGRSARVTLVPAGGGRFRMQINTALRKAASVDAGDVVGVELRLDLSSRELSVPPDLRAGLKAVPKARKAFDELTPGHRRHFIQWFDSAKSRAARQRRLDRAIDVLLERAFLQPRRRQAKQPPRS